MFLEIESHDHGYTPKSRQKRIHGINIVTKLGLDRFSSVTEQGLDQSFVIAMSSRNLTTAMLTTAFSFLRTSTTCPFGSECNSEDVPGSKKNKYKPFAQDLSLKNPLSWIEKISWWWG